MFINNFVFLLNVELFVLEKSEKREEKNFCITKQEDDRFLFSGIENQ